MGREGEEWDVGCGSCDDGVKLKRTVLLLFKLVNIGHCTQRLALPFHADMPLCFVKNLFAISESPSRSRFGTV